MQGSSSTSTTSSGLASSLHGFSASSARSFGLQAEPHKALFTKAAVITNNNNKTIVLRVAMTSPRVRTVCEDALLSVRGVVSFTFDGEANRFTVRARKDVEAEMLFDAILDSDDSIEICQVVKTADGKVSDLFLFIHNKQTNNQQTNNSPILFFFFLIYVPNPPKQETLVHPWREEDDDNENDEEEEDENNSRAGNNNTAAATATKRGGKQAVVAAEDEGEDGYWDEQYSEDAKKKSAVTLQGHDFEADDKRGGGWLGGFGNYLSKSIWG